MEGSGDEEPEADGPLQQLLKRQRKEKRELQGEGPMGRGRAGGGEGQGVGERRAAPSGAHLAGGW